jgi:hypothetical protein
MEKRNVSDKENLDMKTFVIDFERKSHKNWLLTVCNVRFMPSVSVQFIIT